MKVKNLITTVSHKIHHHHHHEDDPENSFHLNYEGSSTVEKVKKKSKPIIKEDEFKSKWDQFCDFTSINGFRLLSSKFSWTMRIATATIMFVATCGLFWNVSGAFIKYFNPSGQKNTVVHQGEYEIMDLPKVRFCHQSKNARASVDPDVLSLLHEDSRRLLYLYDIEGVTADMLKREKLPYLYYFMTEANDITFEGRNCISDFYKLQNDCKHVTLYQSYCSIFRSPPNSTNIEDLTVPEMLQAKRDYDNCLVNEYLDSNNNPKSNNIEGFYCCRIKKAFFEFKKIKDENFEEFLSKNNKQELFVWSSSTNFTVTEEWDSLYGKCSTYTLNQFITDNPFDGKPLLSINFLLNTFAFDIMSDDGVIASFVFDNYRANEFVLLPNAQTTIKIKESFDINDYDCTSKYPSLCSDAREPYNDRICEECYNTRKNCHCDNPLRKSDNFGRAKKSICNVHDSILCLLQKTSTGQDVCPNPCISKFYRSLTTLDNFNITLLNVSTDEMTQIKEDFVSTINYLINTIDKTSAVFPLGNHALWEAVYFLEEIFEEFWKILFLVTKLSGKQL
uniref:Uncharacterized protein n=1 Tax=Panagrolaimus davidi TaxID=227884 RepID=A0A914PPA6_9BILA